MRSKITIKILKKRRSAGVSLIELIVTVAMISILGSMGFYVATNLVQNSKNTKLVQDVTAINSALRLFEASGGDLGGETNPEKVIAKLKASMKGTAAAKMAGHRGRLVDPGLTISKLDGQPSPNGQRAIWSPLNRRFLVLEDSGTDGIAEFRIDPTVATVDYGQDDTRKSAFDLSLEKNFVWDYESKGRDRGMRRPGATTPGGRAVPAGASPKQLRLSAPTFSQAGGTLPLANYPLDLSITNPNSGLPGQLQKAANGGGWVRYTGALTVDPGQTISAMVFSLDPDNYEDSDPTAESYTTIPEELRVNLKFPKQKYDYFELGGDTAAGASAVTLPYGTISLSSKGIIPSRYQSTQYLRPQWTYDNSDPLTSKTAIPSPDFAGGFPSEGIRVPLSLAQFDAVTDAAPLVVKAGAVSKNAIILTSSPVDQQSLERSKIKLEPPSISLSGKEIVLAFVDPPAKLPAGARIFYTTDNEDPGDVDGAPARGQLYSGKFPLVGAPGSKVTIKARVYAPDHLKKWFIPSEAESKTFLIPLGEDFYVGGSFYRDKGASFRNIARLTGEGNVDLKFDTGSGATQDSVVGVIRALSSGSVFAGGDFEDVDNVDRDAVVRLNANGAVDGGFDAKLSGN